MASLHDDLWRLIEGYLEKEHVELDDLALKGPEGRRVLRVSVDAEEGLDIDRIADLSRGLSRLLDAEDRIQGSYRLEVGTPGLERELRLPKHFRKSLGREVVIKTSREIDGSRRHAGRLVAADDAELTVATDDGAVVVRFEDVLSAKTVFVWERGAKPGSRQETA